MLVRFWNLSVSFFVVVSCFRLLCGVCVLQKCKKTFLNSLVSVLYSISIKTRSSMAKGYDIHSRLMPWMRHRCYHHYPIIHHITSRARLALLNFNTYTSTLDCAALRCALFSWFTSLNYDLLVVAFLFLLYQCVCVCACNAFVCCGFIVL